MHHANNMSPKQHKSTALWMLLTGSICIPSVRKLFGIVCITRGQTVQQTSSSWLQTTQNTTHWSTSHNHITDSTHLTIAMTYKKLCYHRRTWDALCQSKPCWLLYNCKNTLYNKFINQSNEVTKLEHHGWWMCSKQPRHNNHLWCQQQALDCRVFLSTTRLTCCMKFSKSGVRDKVLEESTLFLEVPKSVTGGKKPVRPKSARFIHSKWFWHSTGIWQMERHRAISW